jgi:hypothetical protein
MYDDIGYNLKFTLKNFQGQNLIYWCKTNT